MITTYEGQHSHHSVGFAKGAGLVPQEAAFSRHILNAPSSNSHLYYPNLQYPQQYSPSVTQMPPITTQAKHGESRGGQEAAGSSQPSAGGGLLGDIVPPGMRSG